MFVSVFMYPLHEDSWGSRNPRDRRRKLFKLLWCENDKGGKFCKRRFYLKTTKVTTASMCAIYACSYTAVQLKNPTNLSCQPPNLSIFDWIWQPLPLNLLFAVQTNIGQHTAALKCPRRRQRMGWLPQQSKSFAVLLILFLFSRTTLGNRLYH